MLTPEPNHDCSATSRKLSAREMTLLDNLSSLFPRNHCSTLAKPETSSGHNSAENADGAESDVQSRMVIPQFTFEHHSGLDGSDRASLEHGPWRTDPESEHPDRHDQRIRCTDKVNIFAKNEYKNTNEAFSKVAIADPQPGKPGETLGHTKLGLTAGQFGEGQSPQKTETPEFVLDVPANKVDHVDGVVSKVCRTPDKQQDLPSEGGHRNHHSSVTSLPTIENILQIYSDTETTADAAPTRGTLCTLNSIQSDASLGNFSLSKIEKHIQCYRDGGQAPQLEQTQTCIIHKNRPIRREPPVPVNSGCGFAGPKSEGDAKLAETDSNHSDGITRRERQLQNARELNKQKYERMFGQDPSTLEALDESGTAIADDSIIAEHAHADWQTWDLSGEPQTDRPGSSSAKLQEKPEHRAALTNSNFVYSITSGSASRDQFFVKKTDSHRDRIPEKPDLSTLDEKTTPSQKSSANSKRSDSQSALEEPGIQSERSRAQTGNIKPSTDSGHGTAGKGLTPCPPKKHAHENPIAKPVWRSLELQIQDCWHRSPRAHFAEGADQSELDSITCQTQSLDSHPRAMLDMLRSRSTCKDTQSSGRARGPNQPACPLESEVVRHFRRLDPEGALLRRLIVKYDILTGRLTGWSGSQVDAETSADTGSGLTS